MVLDGVLVWDKLYVTSDKQNVRDYYDLDPKSVVSNQKLAKGGSH